MRESIGLMGLMVTVAVALVLLVRRVRTAPVLLVGLLVSPALAHHGSDTESTTSGLWSAVAFAGLALLVGAVVAVVVRLLTKGR